MAVINTFSAGMPSNIGTWNLRSDSPTFRITAHQLVGGAVELYFSTTAGRINWDYWTLNNPDTRFPKWFLEASTFISHPKSQCAVTINFPISTVMVVNFGSAGSSLPPPDIVTDEVNVVTTASSTPWSTPTTQLISFKKYGDVGWMTVYQLSKVGDTTTPYISFDFPGGQWPSGFKPLPSQSFPFQGVYTDVQQIIGKYDYNNLIPPSLQPLYYDVTVRLEIQPTDLYNVVRIIAPCFFQGSGVGAHPWPSIWVVSWPTQTFCYKIDSSV